MGKLTPLSKLLITVLIVGAVYFLARKFVPSLAGIVPNTTTTTTTTTTNSKTTDHTAPTTTRTDNHPNVTETKDDTPTKSFNYTPPEPTGGKLKGVVELGASGFNSFVINVDAQKNWKLERAEYGSSLVYEKLATDDDIRIGLKKYISDMLAYGVSPREIHFVISSGAKKVDITQKISAQLKKMGYVVNEVTPEQEGKLALKSVLPPFFDERAFVVDIGSGNTKISWMRGSAPAAVEAPGAKYFQQGQTDDQVYQDVLAKSKSVPANLRETCFIIGGIPFELAKQVRNGKERYTVLKAPSAYTASGEKQKAGLNIYKAIADGTGCKQFVFDWDANFTIGFLLNL